VEGFRVAEPVVTLSGTGAEGGYASVTVADAAMTVSLDGTGIGPAAAVAAVPNAATAYAALTEVAHLKAGERVLVHGALGGLASAFPGVARTLGAASVTGTARSSSLAAARASALPYDEVIASEDHLAALGGQRFDVVIDPVGGQVRTDSLKVMAPLGRMLLVGNASGGRRPDPASTLTARQEPKSLPREATGHGSGIQLPVWEPHPASIHGDISSVPFRCGQAPRATGQDPERPG